MVSIHWSADVAWRHIGKWISCEELKHARRSFQQPRLEIEKPRSEISECREPHLPVQPRLMRHRVARRSRQTAWHPFKLVRFPGYAVGAAFDDDFKTCCRHDCKQAVIIDQVKTL